MAKKTIHEKLTNYDPAEDLGSDEAIAVFMAEPFQTSDPGYIAHALGVVARAKGMAQIAGQTGLSREQLYRSFSAKGNPTLKTTLAVMNALGVQQTAKIPSAARGRRKAAGCGSSFPTSQNRDLGHPSLWLVRRVPPAIG